MLIFARKEKKKLQGKFYVMVFLVFINKESEVSMKSILYFSLLFSECKGSFSNILCLLLLIFVARGRRGSMNFVFFIFFNKKRISELVAQRGSEGSESRLSNSLVSLMVFMKQGKWCRKRLKRYHTKRVGKGKACRFSSLG